MALGGHMLERNAQLEDDASCCTFVHVYKLTGNSLCRHLDILLPVRERGKGRRGMCVSQ